jgi:hypothetical protein
MAKRSGNTMEKGEEAMAEPESITLVSRELQNLKGNLPGMAEDLSKALDRIWPELIGTIATREDEIRFRMAIEKLEAAVSSLHAAMSGLGYTAKSALEGGNLSPKQQKLCEVLYEIFIPERSSSSS